MATRSTTPSRGLDFEEEVLRLAETVAKLLAPSSLAWLGDGSAQRTHPPASMAHSADGFQVRRAATAAEAGAEAEAETEAEGGPKQQQQGRARPGDVILLATEGLAYAVGRRVTGQARDHAVVVLRGERVLHVSPPVIRVLPLATVLVKARSPVVLRPQLAPAEREDFLLDLERLVGRPYSLWKLFATFSSLAVGLPGSNSSSSSRGSSSGGSGGEDLICSDAILRALGRSSEGFDDALQSGGFLSGSLTDFVSLSRVYPHLLRPVDIVSPASAAWAAPLGLEYVVVGDLDDADPGPRSGGLGEQWGDAATMRRFGVVGQTLDLLQAALAWLVDADDWQALSALARGLERKAGALGVNVNLSLEELGLTSPHLTTAAYACALLLLLRHGRLVARLVAQALRALLMRRLFLKAWAEVTAQPATSKL